MARKVTAAVLLIAVAAAIFFVVTNNDADDPPPSTTASTVATSSPPTEPPPTTSPPPTTTTAPPSSTVPSTSESTTNPEARTEEVRLILQELYYQWFDAIYRNDETAVREIIATEQYLEAFRTAVQNLDLPSAPDGEEIRITDISVLRDDDSCLVTDSVLDLTAWQGPNAIVESVHVLLRLEGTWRFGTSWSSAADQWEQDCLIDPKELP